MRCVHYVLIEANYPHNQRTVKDINCKDFEIYTICSWKSLLFKEIVNLFSVRCEI